MLRRKKSKNILLSLRDRELNVLAEPFNLSLNAISCHIRSDNTYYKFSWHKESKKAITYDFGHLYFNDYSLCYTVYGRECKPSPSYNFLPGSARKKIIDIISYNTPVSQTFEKCNCLASKCSCTSRFILCLTEDNWLCQYNLNNGELKTEVYVQRLSCKIKFKYCDWDKYAERVILTSTLNPHDSPSARVDVVVNLAVFTTFPLQFMALFEIRRSVFGKSCSHVNVGDELLILGMGHDKVHIYSFNTLLEKGQLDPFKLGDQYSFLGRVGEHPTGLPLNFHISSAPPLLFDVRCFGQSVCFGGYPYHCIFPDPSFHLRFNIRNLKADSVPNSAYIDSDVWNDEPNIVSFHPDNSNRIISRGLLKLRVFDLSYKNGQLEMKESHSMELESCSEFQNRPVTSRFGRRLSNVCDVSFLLNGRSILATDYEDELDLFGILGICTGDPECKGFVRLYDSFTGEEVKTIALEQSLSDIYYYTLHIDRDLIIIIEKELGKSFRVYVYNIAECM